MNAMRDAGVLVGRTGRAERAEDPPATGVRADEADVLIAALDVALATTSASY